MASGNIDNSISTGSNNTIAPQTENVPLLENIQVEGDSQKKNKPDDEDENNKDDEEDQEPPTPEILAWRETMNSTPLQAHMRFYLKGGEDDVYWSFAKPVQPATVRNDSEFLTLLNTSNVPRGWYWVVICVSLKDVDTSLFEQIVFDVRNGDYDGVYYVMDCPCTTVLEKDDINNLPKDDFVRLRLHRQVSINDPEDCIWVSIEAKTLAGTTANVTFDVNYIDLAHPSFRSSTGDKDHILWGEGKPDQFIRVGVQGNEPIQAPVAIEAYDFSDPGTHVATLYFTPGQAHIDVWDLRTPNKKASSGKPQAFTIPSAQISFPVSTELTTSLTKNSVEMSINISSSASQIAFGFVDKSDHAIPFSLFTCPPKAPADHDLSKPWTLKKVSRICSNLENYFGYGSFHISDLDSPKEDDERFFTFNGIKFDVYSTQGTWEQLYSLTLGVDPDPEIRLNNVLVITKSLRGRYFAWAGAKGAVSIWDFETGKIVTSIPVPEDRGNITAALSLDGSMIAISVNSSIQIHDILSGIKLGIFKTGLSGENDFEVVFGKDYFMCMNVDESTGGGTAGNTITIDAHSIVRARDMKIVKTFILFWKYEVEYPQPVEEPVFAYRQGAILNIKHVGNILSPAEDDTSCPDGACELEDTDVDLFYHGWSTVYKSSAGVSFNVRVDFDFSRGSYVRQLIISTGTKSVALSFGSNNNDYQGFFMPQSSQLVFTSGCYLQVWKLSDTSDELCELVYTERFFDIPQVHSSDYFDIDTASVQVCKHGRQFNIGFKPFKWFRGMISEEVKDDTDTKSPQMLTLPRTVADTFSLSEEQRQTNGVIFLIDTYSDSDINVRKAVARYLGACIRPSLKQPTSCLVTLCRAWTDDNRVYLEKLLADLLPANRITWIPNVNATNDDDPLSIFIEIAKTSPSALGACKVVMDYCVNHAIGSKNLSFLSPLFRSLHDIMDLFPDEALECLGRIAYLPVRRRDFILENHIVAQSPRLRLPFLNKASLSLDKMKDPIMQLHVTPDQPDARVDNFTRPIFMASFDALWYYKNDEETKKDVLEEAMITKETTWWKTLYHMIALKFHLRTHTYVTCHDFSLEFFDNPAIAALVAYKWNTIGYAYWAVRFFFQCIFYTLVTTAALMQVYHTGLSQRDLAGIFIAIIVFGVAFLWLELLQAIKNWSRYTNIYNLLDMVAYTVPLAASVNQLVVLYRNDTNGNTAILSYAVLAIFIHMLFELRINKSVCKYVTIIQETVVEIRVFFIIFAAGLFAFTVATLHLLRACPVLDGCSDPTTKLSGHFLGALSATYFFMGGRYDPVSDEFDSDDWGFHIMMAVYFFFTVIVMLNMLIALINVAFLKGDESWRLVWIESRLRYIESAENMSYHIPGFRQSHNWFPKEIYFSATTQDVREYRKKYHAKDNNPGDLNLPEDWARDFQGDDNDGYEKPDTKAGLSHKRPLLKAGDVVRPNKDSDSNKSVNGDAEEQSEESNKDAEIQEAKQDNTKDKENEEAEAEREGKEVTASGSSVDKGKDTVTSDSSVQELKAQVADLQKQLASQQEQAQRQFQELKELLVNRASA